MPTLPVHLLAKLICRHVRSPKHPADSPENAHPPPSSAVSKLAGPSEVRVLVPPLLSAGKFNRPELLQTPLRELWAELAWRQLHAHARKEQHE